MCSAQTHNNMARKAKKKDKGKHGGMALMAVAKSIESEKSAAAA